MNKIWRFIALVCFATFSTITLSLPPTPVSAHGTYFFNLNGIQTATRNDESTATYRGRLEAVENGSLKNDNLGFVDINISLKKISGDGTGINDRWTISSVKFSNARASSDNPRASVTIIDGSTLKLTNANNESQTYNYSNPSAITYGYIVTKSKVANGFAIDLYDNFGQAGEVHHGNGPGTNLDPIAGLTRGPQPRIDNYDLKSSGGGGKYDLATIQGWFDNDDISGLFIITVEKKGEPPKVLVAKSKLGNRSPGDLTFKLIAFSGEGAVTAGNRDWLTFQAYLGESKVENLYLSVSDNLDANFYYGTNYEAIKKGQHPDTSGVPDINGTVEIARAIAANGDDFVNSLDKLFSYIVNIPVNASGTPDAQSLKNCQGTTIKTVGPKGDASVTPLPDYKTTTEASVSGSDARGFNQNCANLQPNGWLQYWGVTDLSSADPGGFGGQCSLFAIIGLGEIGKIFSGLTDCLFKSIFNPMVKWAAEFLEDAAGVSYRYKPENFYDRHVA